MFKENIYFIKKSVTLPRLWNLIKNQMSYFLSNLLRKSIIWGYPPVLMIEPTNICNLKCPLCPSGNGTLKREKGYLDFAVFKKIIDEVKDKTMMLILWNQGEPFLNKQFLKMVKYASDRGLFVLVSTNGNYIPDAEAIVNSGLDSLIISLDGTTQEVYNKYRVNGNLKNVLDNAHKITIAKKKFGSKIPIVKWQFIVMKHNEHQIEEIKKLAQKIEVDQLQLKSVQIYSKEDVENFLPINPKYRRYKIKGNNFELKYGIKNKCKRLWRQPVVNWNGEMAVCCFDKDIDYKVGNIQKSKFIDIWKGEKFNRMRQTILTNRKSIPMCRNCGEGVKLKIKEKKV
jgi:radical SAM protein with 4Fe4S-binding SPASM domain